MSAAAAVAKIGTVRWQEIFFEKARDEGVQFMAFFNEEGTPAYAEIGLRVRFGDPASQRCVCVVITNNILPYDVLSETRARSWKNGLVGRECVIARASDGRFMLDFITSCDKSIHGLEHISRVRFRDER